MLNALGASVAGVRIIWSAWIAIERQLSLLSTRRRCISAARALVGDSRNWVCAVRFGLRTVYWLGPILSGSEHDTEGSVRLFSGRGGLGAAIRRGVKSRTGYPNELLEYEMEWNE